MGLNFGRKQTVLTANELPEWQEETKREIKKRKRAILRHLKEHSYFKKSQFHKAQNSKEFAGMISAGATSDESNVDFYVLRENGFNRPFMLKTNAAVDSAISAPLFRILAARRCFAMDEVIVYDEGREKYYPAIEFETDIVKDHSPSATQEELKEKNILFLNSADDEEAEIEGKKINMRSQVAQKYRDDMEMMMDYAYMCAITWILGECDENPGNFVLDKSGRVGRIDLGCLTNTHPDPFSRVIAASDPAFLDKVENYLKEGSLEMENAYEKAQSIAGARRHLRELIEHLETDNSPSEEVEEKTQKIEDLKRKISAVTNFNQDPKATYKELEKDLQEAYKEAAEIKKRVLPHKDYLTRASDFAVDSSIKNTDRAKVYGSRQAIMFLINEIAGLNYADYSFEAAKVSVIREDGDPMPEPGFGFFIDEDGDLCIDPKEKITKNHLRQCEDLFQKAMMKPLEACNKDVILEKIEEKISSETNRRTFNLFIAFMHGIEEAILLSQDWKFLKEYSKSFEKSGRDNAVLAKKMVGFFVENGKQAEKDFEPFLQYYRKIKHNLRAQDFEQRCKDEFRATQTISLPKEKIEAFENGETAVLDKEYVEKAWDRCKKKLQLLPNEEDYFFENWESSKKRKKHKFESECQDDSIYPVILHHPTVLGGLALTKSSALENGKIKEILRNNDPFDGFSAENFSQQTLFAENVVEYDNENVEIHANFAASGLNFGNDVLRKRGGFAENKIRCSKAGFLLSFLHQRPNADSQFLDLRMKDGDLYGKNGGLNQARAILIEGQYFSCHKKIPATNDRGSSKTDISDQRIDELSLAMSTSNSERNYGDVARNLFLTAYEGFMLCKNMHPSKNVTIVSTPIEESSISPHLQLSMQILAANMADVELKITDKTNCAPTLSYKNAVSKDNCREHIAKFKKEVLPNLNQVLRMSKMHHGEFDNMDDRIVMLDALCRYQEMDLARYNIDVNYLSTEIVSYIEKKRRGEVEPVLLLDSRGVHNLIWDRQDAVEGKRYKMLAQIICQAVENGTQLASDLSDVFKILPKIPKIQNLAQLETHFRTLFDLDLAQSRDVIFTVNAKTHPIQKQLKPQKIKVSSPKVKKIFVDKEDKQSENVFKREVFFKPKETDDFKAIGRIVERQRTVDETNKQLDSIKNKVETVIERLLKKPLPQLEKFCCAATRQLLQEKGDGLLPRIKREVRQNILVLFEAMAQHAQGLIDVGAEEFLNNQAGEVNIGGFTSWRKDAGFRGILKEIYERFDGHSKSRLTGFNKYSNPKSLSEDATDLRRNDVSYFGKPHDDDFSSDRSDMMNMFALLSHEIQMCSKGIFTTIEGKDYGGEHKGQDMARSWRIALMHKLAYDGQLDYEMPEIRERRETIVTDLDSPSTSPRNPKDPNEVSYYIR